ncbi:glutamate-5-semialdehyde dehydrogenase [Pragia fontium]|uniref:Gamma-glutamyl phosphate reductase n=2 Tax=Pragia fontium TaxID=82985 RepID=A0AAJ5BH92_9GAMM|nr:glutamate-5-semialdehyde dehydrogenase [Pragia fontium]GKX62318.1 gamma-glutamyl phosphate reductase [Pragia fontium]SFC87237.1 glutamate-5-semialdehyde dehydrogenase [Pragia fontium DSM 5563 = ATCC 49100]VEJ56078.1 Gamma-glutamyl phosphate reductase [Pragia fontium]
MLEQMGRAAKQASYQLAVLNSAKKNQALAVIADTLEANSEVILAANEKDIEQAKQAGLSEAMIDRLQLTPSRLAAIANDVRHVYRLTDPVGHIIDGSQLDNGLSLQRRRVPLGVVGVIYESRPNVTIDVASLCLKTGNAVILRGGKETVNTNQAMVAVVQSALEKCGLPAAAVQSIDNPDRALINELLKLDRYVDMIIPRGGAALHKLCKENSTIPVIIGGIGVCHTFVDACADFDKALTIIENAKTQRPSTCNTLETLLVHRSIAAEFLPKLGERMHSCGVTLHASPEAMMYLSGGEVKLVAVNDPEYGEEWLSLDLNVKVVEGMDEAIEHIRTYGSAHSDAILTRSLINANRFVSEVDSAAVYVNASTRFTDGGQFGLGAEVAVSTQKLHARGPMGLEALTTYKWIGYGDDLIRR